MSSVYDRGRTLPLEAVTVWVGAAQRHIGDDAERVLDLGSGTGRFSAPLADTFHADVVAVEPSAGMRSHAARKHHPRVRVVGGAAEAIPLSDDTCDAAWLSNVIHHLDDLEAAARELRRVLVPDAPVLIRGAFAGREYRFTLYDFFPKAEPFVEGFPSMPETIELFERAGFTTFSVEMVEQVTARSYSDALEATRMRADTLLEALSDEAFERGLERLAEAARTEEGPVVDSLDLLAAR